MQPGNISSHGNVAATAEKSYVSLQLCLTATFTLHRSHHRRCHMNCCKIHAEKRENAYEEAEDCVPETKLWGSIQPAGGLVWLQNTKMF